MRRHVGEKEPKDEGAPKGFRLVDFCALMEHEIESPAAPGELPKRYKQHSIAPSNSEGQFDKESMQKVEKLTLAEHIFCIIVFLITVPGIYVSFPLGTLFFIYYLSHHPGYIIGVLCVIFVLAFHPLKDYWPPPVVHFKRLWLVIFRYFSFKAVLPTDKLDPKASYIFCAPPHGVIPIGNILAITAFQYTYGVTFHGLVASVVLRTPLLRYIAQQLGAIDASRDSAANALLSGHSLGLPSGGIAEIFETNNKDEVIWLSRTGFVRLALTTGSYLVPCYLVGNTQTLRCFSDRWGILQSISRKLQLSVTFFWGRFGLPIPFRVRILGLMGNPIPVPRIEEPTKEQIQFYHDKCTQELQRLYDLHCESYGWPHRKLIIK